MTEITDPYERGFIDGMQEQMRRSVDRAVNAMVAEKKEPVTVLPDGSAFGLMSFPLPDNHWIYAAWEYRDGENEPIELPKPILTHAVREEVVKAVRYAVRSATMRGQETDFDPDALVQNAVYALCGSFTSAQPKPLVGLTPEELSAIWDSMGTWSSTNIQAVYNAIWKAIKEKNT